MSPLFLEACSWRPNPEDPDSRISSAPLITLDRDGIITASNESGRLFVRHVWHSDLSCGRSFFDIVTATARPLLRTHLDQALSGKLITELITVRADDEESISFHIHYRPCLQGEAKIVGVCLEVTLVESDTSRTGSDSIDPLLQEIVSDSSEMVAIIDADGFITYLSAAADRLLGVEPGALTGHLFTDNIAAEDYPQIASLLEAAAREHGAVTDFTCRLRRRDGAMIWAASHVRNLLNRPGVHGLLIHTRDITRERLFDQEAREADRRYRSIFENAAEGIYLSSPDGRLLNANSSFAHILGYADPADLIDNVHDVGRDLYVDPRRRNEFVQQVLSHDRIAEFESLMWRRNGKAIWVSENARALRRPDGTISGYEGSLQDISRRKEAEERLLHNSLFDSATGLPNRQLFLDRLRQLLLHRDGQHSFAVLSLTVDRWRNISESHSPRFVDDLLCMIAERLEKIERPGDTASHISASEFSLLLEHISSPKEVEAFATELRRRLTEPFTVDQERIDISCCVGIYCPDLSAKLDPEEILENARAALAKAHSLGQDQQENYAPGYRDLLVSMRKLEVELRHAVEDDQFLPFFQPIVGLKTMEVSGFEALVRWQHPIRGIIPPVEFIPLAEDSGLVHPIGLTMLTKSCEICRTWINEIPQARDIFLSVNLSMKQFRYENLADQLLAVIEQTDFPPEQLKLEITESAVMQNWDKALKVLQRLRDAGIRFSMDDFGTGYSSLSYLSRMPLDTLKIDRSFTCRVGQPGPGEDILRTISTLAHALSMDIVAEGIETREQMDFLERNGCEYGQGYIFAKPLPETAAKAFLQSSPLNRAALTDQS